MNRERLVPNRRVRDPRFPDLDRGEVGAERLPKVTKAVVTREQAVRESSGPAVELERKRVQVIVDRVAGVVKRQAARVRAPAGVVEAQHERMGRQIALGLQVIPPEAQRVAGVHVPVELGDELVVVGVVQISLIRSRVVPVHVLHHIANRIHHLNAHTRDP